VRLALTLEQDPGYLRAGVRVPLNSDDPGLFGTTLRDDWERVDQELAPSEDERRSLVWNSVEAALLPDAERAVLRARVRQDLAAVATPL